MALFIRSLICVAFVAVPVMGCGDEKGYPSLDAFYGASPAPSSSSGGTSSSSGGSSGGSIPVAGSCGVSLTSLVAYLPFDGDARVRGGSTFGLSSTSNSNLGFTSGREGSALRGTHQIFLDASTSVSFPSWTVCAWILMGGTTAMGILVAPPMDVAVGRAGSTAPCGSGQLAPYVSSSQTGCFSPASATLLPSRWSFVCLVNDASAGQMRFDVDGVSTSRGTTLPIQVSSGRSIGIGGGPEDDMSAIDEVSLWSRALTERETQKLSGDGSGCTVLTEESR